MQKTVYTLLFIFILSACFGQAYKPMLKENKVWDALEEWTINPFPQPPGYDYEQYELEWDTVVNNMQYFKMMARDQVQGTYIPVYDTTAVFSGILLREDSVARKIWKRDVFGVDTAEYLIYDFSLSIGDTITSMNGSQVIPQHNYGGIRTAVIDTILPHVLNNGDTTRAFYITPINFWIMSWPSYILEGVGSVQGFHSPFNDDFELIYFLSCVKDEGVDIYTNATGGSCGYYLSAEKIEKNNEVGLYPNPASSQITIVSQQEFTAITILSITGKVIQTQLTQSKTIDVAKLSRGIYFIQLVGEEGMITKKFVKE